MLNTQDGGTKTEMQRLLKDAQKLSGVKYDISNLSDVYSAIHVIQEELGVTGTTAKEASTTISGSVKTMKASFNNFLNGSGSPEDLADSILIAFNNVAKSINKLAPKILDGIVKVIDDILPSVIDALNENLPILMNSALDLMQNLLNSIVKNTKPIVEMVKKVMTNIVTFITNNLPAIFKAGLEILIELMKGISENLDTIVPAIVDCVLEIVQTLLDNIDLVIDAGIQLVVGLAGGLVKGIPKIIEKIPEIIGSILKAFTDLFPDLFDLGGQMLDKIIEGIKNIGSKIKDLAKWIWNKIKEALLGGGVVDLAESKIDQLTASTQKAQSNLSTSVSNGSNPYINTSTSSPLILNIDTFNNNSSSDVQELAGSLEYYRRNSALARGGK